MEYTVNSIVILYNIIRKGGVAVKLSEKIIELRKANGMTQEELATILWILR